MGETDPPGTVTREAYLGWVGPSLSFYQSCPGFVVKVEFFMGGVTELGVFSNEQVTTSYCL